MVFKSVRFDKHLSYLTVHGFMAWQYSSVNLVIIGRVTEDETIV